ncbi:MAG TPA: type II secretion system protein GspG [Phycisphaerae bacterium]|nr:type II secretion system protein GspG [Phycisphaerae bacterium]HUT57532.1 type II secretion system protein GspG [Phycisphaerae bacterium]
MKAGARRRRGFTLVEILLVVAIIATLATVAVVMIAPRREEAREKITKTKVQKVMAAIELFNNSVGSYPSAEQGLKALIEEPTFEDESMQGKWRGPYCKLSDLKDQWGQDLVYNLEEVETSGTTRSVPRVYSYGPNKTDDSGEGDDIRNDAWAQEAAAQK